MDDLGVPSFQEILSQGWFSKLDHFPTLVDGLLWKSAPSEVEWQWKIVRRWQEVFPELDCLLTVYTLYNSTIVYAVAARAQENKDCYSCNRFATISGLDVTFLFLYPLWGFCLVLQRLHNSWCFSFGVALPAKSSFFFSLATCRGFMSRGYMHRWAHGRYKKHLMSRMDRRQQPMICYTWVVPLEPFSQYLCWLVIFSGAPKIGHTSGVLGTSKNHMDPYGNITTQPV